MGSRKVGEVKCVISNWTVSVSDKISVVREALQKEWVIKNSFSQFTLCLPQFCCEFLCIPLLSDKILFTKTLHRSHLLRFLNDIHPDWTLSMKKNALHSEDLKTSQKLENFHHMLYLSNLHDFSKIDLFL